MKKKIHSYMREKGLLDPMDVMIDCPFTKEILDYPNIKKHKPQTLILMMVQETISIMSKPSNRTFITSTPLMLYMPSFSYHFLASYPRLVC